MGSFLLLTPVIYPAGISAGVLAGSHFVTLVK